MRGIENSQENQAADLESERVNVPACKQHYCHQAPTASL